MSQSHARLATQEYSVDIKHYASSSSEVSACSVEPGSAKDVGEIVRYSDLTHGLSPTRILLASYSGIDPNAVWGERCRACHQPGILLDEWRRDRHVAIQPDKSRLHDWDS